jgi:hypothetical protein
MKWFSAIAMSLLLIIGLTAEAKAVTSGVYKCNVFQGPLTDASTTIIPVLTHYNPNAIVQNITRVRAYNKAGTLIMDHSFPIGTNAVNAHGSISTTITTDFFEGLQAIVNWQQGSDALAPVPKLTLLLFNTTSGVYTSVSQSVCP